MSDQILVTTDFSDAAARAYQPAGQLAARLGTSILLLTVVDYPAVTPSGAALAPAQEPPDLAGRIAEAEQRIAAEARRITGGVKVEILVRSGTDIATEVVRVAAERKVSFIALSTHGRSGLRRLVVGSVAELILRNARTPVICYPGP